MFEQTETPIDYAPPRLSLGELEAALGRGDSIIGLFSGAGQLIGYIWWDIRHNGLYASSAAIHPAYRGHGLMTAMLNAAENYLRISNLTMYWFSVDPFNGPMLYVAMRQRMRIKDENY